MNLDHVALMINRVVVDNFPALIMWYEHSYYPPTAEYYARIFSVKPGYSYNEIPYIYHHLVIYFYSTAHFNYISVWANAIFFTGA